MVRIAILASGSGSNAEKIMQYLQFEKNMAVSVVVTNRKAAGVIDRARKYDVPVKFIPNSEWSNESLVLPFFQESKIDLIVLAGYLRKIPEYLLDAYPRRIINIHPALLPAYGGKGMYGMHVHRSVCENNDAESGVTIHIVNEEFDQGEIIFQAKCSVEPKDQPEDVQRKVHELEHQYFPIVVQYVAEGIRDL